MGTSYSKPKSVDTKHFDDFKRSKSFVDLNGKTKVITGTTSGLGFVTARTAAEQGGRVILLNRPSERAQASLKKLQDAHPAATYVQIDCDLQSFDSVRAAAAKINEDYGEVDSLVCNAGIMAVKDEATVDGYDRQMQVNHLSHFLLTRDLMPSLLAAAAARGEARIIAHSSILAEGTPLDAKYLGKNGGNLGGDSTLNPLPCTGPRWERYHQTKLANLVFTMALADRIEEKKLPLKALAAHPGISATELQVKAASEGSMGHTVSKVLPYQSEEDGALPIITCMMDPDVQNRNYYGPAGRNAGKAVLLNQTGKEHFNQQEQKDLLWKASEEAVGEFTL